MARSVVSDSDKDQEMESESGKRAEDDAQDGEEEEEEEYEIEAILDAKRGIFPGVSYFTLSNSYLLTGAIT